ncbi:MAG TPA: hypothetical protein VF290_02615 [Pyrinomonadaceae bacterium]
MRNRPKSEPVDPTPPMPRGETEFEEKLIERDFIAVFIQISNSLFHSIQESHEYVYRAGRVAEKARHELPRLIEGRKYPTYMNIL